MSKPHPDEIESDELVTATGGAVRSNPPIGPTVLINRPPIPNGIGGPDDVPQPQGSWGSGLVR